MAVKHLAVEWVGMVCDQVMLEKFSQALEGPAYKWHAAASRWKSGL